jgi:hypothetical protein
LTQAPVQSQITAADSSADTELFNLGKFKANADEWAARYAVNKPFPHIVLDDMLQVGPELAEEHFPGPDWPAWRSLGDSYQVKKFTCDDITKIPEQFARLIHELSTPAFLRALEKVTGIPKLLPDPYLAGGGLHLSGPGGILAPHTDFHIYDAMDLYRRVNVLVYLNDGWDESFGGCLEVGDRGKDGALVVPDWGRVMIFTTDDKSVHGFPKPIVEGHWRRSVALYYYTALEAPGFSGDASTHWRDHGTQRGAGRKLRFGLFKFFMQTSRAFSLLAHLSNPNQGMGWWKHRQQRIAENAEEGR